MQRRIQHIKDVCENELVHGQTLSSIASLGLPYYGKVKDSHSANILVLDKEGIIWCPVPKVASTSWMHNLLHFGSVAILQVIYVCLTLNQIFPKLVRIFYLFWS